MKKWHIASLAGAIIMASVIFAVHAMSLVPFSDKAVFGMEGQTHGSLSFSF